MTAYNAIAEILKDFSFLHNFDERRDERLNSGTRIRMGPTEFNAKLIREQFLKKANSFKCHPIRDLTMFISLFVKYGNNIQKALREINRNTSNIMRVKCIQYGIATDSRTIRKRGLKHDQLSPSRIAHAFPTVTASAILINKSLGILEFSTFFNQELPLIMQHTIFPGLIPAKQFTDSLKEIALVLNVEKSVILSGCLNIGTIRESLGEMIESSVKYVDAAINNDIKDEQKLKTLKETGIVNVKADGEFELTEATVALVNKLEGIKTLYSLQYLVAVRKAKRINNNEDVNSLDSDSD